MRILKSHNREAQADLKVEEFPFDIGRTAPGIVRLKEQYPVLAEGVSYLSKKHACFSLQGQRLHLADVGSLNGTEVNGRSIGQQGVLLSHGDNISFAKKLSFSLEDSNAPQADGSTLTLQPKKSRSGLTALALTEFPSVIGPWATFFTTASGKAKKEVAQLQGNLARITHEEGSYFIEDLGGQSGTEVDGRVLRSERQQLVNGSVVSFSPVLSFTVVTEEGAVDADKTMVMTPPAGAQAAASPSATMDDLADKTVYMESATQFINIVTATKGEEEQGSEPHEETLPAPPLAQRGFFKPLLYGVVLLLVIAGLSAGVYFYNNTGVRKAKKLYQAGDYLAAITMTQELLQKNPELQEGRDLLFSAVVKHSLVPCAAQLLQGNPQGCSDTLTQIAPSSALNSELASVEKLFGIIIDLFSTIRAESIETLQMDVDHTTMYRTIQDRWSANKLNNKSFLDELSGSDPVFVTLRQEVYAKLSILKLASNRRLASVEKLQQQMRNHLAAGTPQKIKALLVDTDGTKFKGIVGIDAYREDLTRYLYVHKMLQEHDSAGLLQVMESPQLSSAIFKEQFAQLMATQAPEPAQLQQLAHAEQLWSEGKSGEAVAVLRGLQSNRWSDFITDRMNHMLLVASKFADLYGQKQLPGYPKALFDFTGLLQSGKDSFYERVAASEAVAVRQELQVEFNSLVAAAQGDWQAYKDGGRITTMQRMENSVSEEYRQQATRLKEAYRKYTTSQNLKKSFGLASTAAEDAFGGQLTKEVVVQKRMIADLQSILSRHIFEEKRRLLPAKVVE